MEQTDIVADTTEGASTPDLPSAFLEAFQDTSVSCCPRDVAAVTSAGMLIDSPRRQMIWGAARLLILGTLPEDEWKVHHRDNEVQTGCKMIQIAFMEDV